MIPTGKFAEWWHQITSEYSSLPKYLPLVLLILSTIASIIVSLYSVQAGYDNIFQNLFYFPIIFACVFYIWRGFFFSCLLSIGYVVLMAGDILTTTILIQVLIRVGLFVSIAGVVTLLVSYWKLSELALLIQHDLSLSLSRCLNMNKALDSILLAALRTEGIDSGGIYVEDSKTGAFDVIAYYGLSPQFIEHISHLNADDPQVQRAKTGTPFFGRYSEIRQPGKDTIRDIEGIKALVSIPLLYKGELIAILNLASHTVHKISPATCTILESLASQAGSYLVSVRSREMLIESQARFQAIFDSASQFIALLEPDGTIIEINETALQFGGLIRANITNRSFSDIHWWSISPDIREQLQKSIIKAANGEFVRYEVDVLGTNDHVITIDFSLKPIINANGTVASLLAEGRDITERKLAEEAIRESEQKYRGVIENIEDIYYRTDNRGIIIMASPSTTKILGYDSLEEILGRHIESFWVDPQGRNEMLQRIREEGRIVDYEEMAKKKDGTIIPVSVTSTNYQDKNGVILGVEGIIRDITDRKRDRDELVRKNEELYAAYEQISATEEELRSHLEKLTLQEQQMRETNAYLESLISVANVPIIVWDPSFKITRLNHAFELLIGRSAEEVIGKTLEFLFPPDKMERSMRLFKTTLNGVRWETVEIDVQHQDGSIRTVLWNSATLYEEDGFTLIATIAQGQDITEMRRLEQEKDAALIQIQKNLAQLAVLNDGIRNPLTVITILADMLEDHKMTEQVRIQTKQIDDMVTQLDNRWADSEKVLSVIRKHYQVFFDPLSETKRDDRIERVETGSSADTVQPAERKDKIMIEEVQAQLFTILDSIDALVYVADMDTHDLLYVNRRGRSLFGDVIGKKCYSTIRGEQDGPCTSCTNHLLTDKSGPTGVYQWEFLNTNNGRWYDCRDRAIHWSDGRLVRLEIATDITGRKKVEKELQETKQRLIDLINFLPDATFAIDNQGRVIIWNKAIEEMTGVFAEDIVGEGNYEYALPFYGERRPILIDLILMQNPDIIETYSYVRREGDTLTAETEKAHPGGKELYLWVKATLLKNVQGEIVGAIESIRDITGKKRSEESLKLKEFAIESSIDGIVIADIFGIITSVNPAFIRIWGLDNPVEVLGRSVFSYWQDMDDATHIATSIQETGSWAGEITGIRRDMTPIVLSTSVNLIHDTSGNQVGIFGSFIDITTQKEMENELRENESRIEEKLQALLSPDGDIGLLELAQIIDVPEIQLLMNDFFSLTRIGVAILDRRGIVLVATGWQDICTKFHRVHPETCKHCQESDINLSQGITPGTFKLYHCKNNMWDIATPITIGGVHIGNLFLGQFFFDDEEIDYSLFKRQARQYGFDEEAYINALEQVPRWSHKTVNSVMQFYTRLIHLIAQVSSSNIRLARIVNERNNLLLSIRESEEKFRSYIINAPDGVFIADEEGHYLEVNPAACEITGYTEKELLQMQISDFLPPESYENGMQHFIQVAEKGSARGESVFRHKDGGIRYWNVEGVKLSPTRFMGFTRDITEKKLMEDALQESNKKLRLLTSLTRHDIFNQLSAVHILHDLALKEDDPNTIHTYISQAQEAGDQIEATIGFTHEYENFGIVTSGWLQIHQIIDSAKKEISLSTLTIHNGVTEDLEVYADPIIRKVFTTLVNNAISHGECSTYIRFYSEEKKETLIIICEDDGIGIPEGEKDLIFHHGYGKNTGIGLFLAREILSITGLSIRETGKEGEGAKFEIRVPAGKWRNAGNQ